MQNKIYMIQLTSEYSKTSYISMLLFQTNILFFYNNKYLTKRKKKGKYIKEKNIKTQARRHDPRHLRRRRKTEGVGRCHSTAAASSSSTAGDIHYLSFGRPPSL